MKKSKKRIARAAVIIFVVSALLCSISALAAPNVTTTVITSNSAPIAENLKFTTYRGIAINGMLSAIDPEGESLTFEIVSMPKKGIVEMADANMFLYTPDEDKKGTDSFTYTAADASGNISSEATVSIKILKQESSISYADMKNHSACYAAVTLAEKGIYTGDRLGSQSFFRPEEDVSRGEFLAMCLSVSGADILDDVTRTGFFDDENISQWVKPYVSTALMSGIITGYKNEDGRLVFSAEEPIRFAEAAVILNNTLGISDVVSAAAIDSEITPVWAYQPVVNLYSCGVITKSIEQRYTETVTRADAALMLVSAMELLSARSDSTLLSWAK